MPTVFAQDNKSFTLSVINTLSFNLILFIDAMRIKKWRRRLFLS